MPKEITIKVKVPTGPELAEALKNTVAGFGELVGFEVVEAKAEQKPAKPAEEPAAAPPPSEEGKPKE